MQRTRGQSLRSGANHETNEGGGIFLIAPFSAGFRTELYGKHRSGSTQKAPRQQTFKFEEVRGDTTAKRVYVHSLLLLLLAALTP